MFGKCGIVLFTQVIEPLVKAKKIILVRNNLPPKNYLKNKKHFRHFIANGKLGKTIAA